MRLFSRWLISLLLIITLTCCFFIAVQNLAPINVSIPFVAEFQVITAVALGSAFFLGGVITALFFGLWLIHGYFKHRALHKELKRLRRALDVQPDIPLTMQNVTPI